MVTADSNNPINNDLSVLFINSDGVVNDKLVARLPDWPWYGERQTKESHVVLRPPFDSFKLYLLSQYRGIIMDHYTVVL